MSSRQHLDDFTQGRIIGKLEQQITDVAREFDIAQRVVYRIWGVFEINEEAQAGRLSLQYGSRRRSMHLPNRKKEPARGAVLLVK